MYFVVTLPLASKTEWSQVAPSLNIERTNVSQNLLVTEQYEGKALSRKSVVSCHVILIDD